MNALIRRLCVLCFVLFVHAAPVVGQTSDDCKVTGRWVNVEKVLTIEMDSTDGKWFGKVLRSSDPEVLVGFVLMKDFTYDAMNREYKARLRDRRADRYRRT